MSPVDPVADLRATAERFLAGHVFGDDSLAKAMAALDEALRLDPSDPEGDTAALLGKVCFQLQDWKNALLHFDSALPKQPGNAEVAELREQARSNGESDIGPPMMIAGLYDRSALLMPPAMHLRAPEVESPAPFNADAPSHISSAWTR